MNAIFGIDFGTSNSSLSINIDGMNKAIDIDSVNENKKLLKSIIFYDYFEKQYCFGQNAVNRYIETDAEGRYIQSVKTFLPNASFTSTQIGGQTFTIEKIVSLILQEIKSAGEAYINHEVQDVVLGRPVKFSNVVSEDSLAEDRLVAAAKLAGFKNIHLEYEPVAAAICYEQTLNAGDEQIVLVCDFGAGTSDFSIIKACGTRKANYHDRKEDIISLGGIYIGGDSLDSDLMWAEIANDFGKNAQILYPMSKSYVNMPPSIMHKLKQWHLIPQLNTPKMMSFLKEISNCSDSPQYIDNLMSLIENNYGYTLFQAIEKSKIELSERNESTIDYSDHMLSIKKLITRDKFNENISSNLDRLVDCINTTILDGGLKITDIDKVILTGGTSNVFLINDYLKRTFGTDKMIQTDTFTSVGQGLGLCGKYFL